jgi:hypothetical protein
VRRLISSTSRTLATLFIGALLTVCSLGVLSAHTSSSNQQKASCSSSCHSHGQASGINNQENKDEEDDKEPIPPVFGWVQIPVNLALLYVMPVFGVLWFVSNKQKILLTTQLRF